MAHVTEERRTSLSRDGQEESLAWGFYDYQQRSHPILDKEIGSYKIFHTVVKITTRPTWVAMEQVTGGWTAVRGAETRTPALQSRSELGGAPRRE